MIITIHTEIEDFLSRAMPALREQEAANNLMLGIALRLQKDRYAYGESVFSATLEEGGALVAAALMTTPHNLIIYCNGVLCSPAWPLVVDVLQKYNWKVPGVTGQSAPARAFARAWNQITGQQTSLALHTRAYELKYVIQPPMLPAGFMRQAVPNDLALGTAWEQAFIDEALGENEPHPSQERTRQRILNGELFLWVDGEPVSMAVTTRPLGQGISIGPVYTPPHKRRRGYASALVAALSQKMLDSGYSYCTLFTDLANPTSNTIYQRIGYRAVCEYDMYKFG
jgi:predicted GNAT family acetyltransferase